MKKSKNGLCGENGKVCCIETKNISYLIGIGYENKKADRRYIKCVIKQKFKFKYYKNSLQTRHHENEINHLEKNKFGVDS